MKLFIFVFFAVFGFIFASTGQGIGTGNDDLESDEIAASVKQEVYLKTSGAEPIQLDRVKRFNDIGGGVSPDRRHSGIGDGVSPRRDGSGIGGGATPTRGHHYGSSGIRDDASPTRGHHYGSSGIGDGVSPRHDGSGIGREATPTRGHRYGSSGIGDGALPNHRSGIGSGTTFSRASNKPEPLGKSWGVIDEEDAEFIMKKDIAMGGSRQPRFSTDDRFDSGYNKDCNSYYGRLICYRIYSNPNIRVPNEMTCWRITRNRKNCTEIDNISYLRDEGYTAYESEVPRARNHRPHQTEQITHGQSQYYDPYNTNQNYNGADHYPKTGNSQRETHKFSTNGLRLNTDSLEDDDSVELVRDKRKSGGKNTFRNRKIQRNRNVNRPVSSDPKPNPI